MVCSSEYDSLGYSKEYSKGINMGYILGVIAIGLSHNDIFKKINPREYAKG